MESSNAQGTGVGARPTSAGRKLLRVATRCTSMNEFLATFSRFVDDTSVTIVTSQPRPIGTKQPFAIQLKDGETVMRGECEVVESNRAAGGRPSMRLRLLQVDEATREIHRQLLARSKRGTMLGLPPVPAATPPPPPDVSEDAAPSAGPPPIPPAETKRADTVPGPAEQRVPGATYTLPANPLGELADEALGYFIECTLYEETGLHPLSEVLGLDAPPETTPPPAPAPTVPTPPLPAPAEDTDLAGYLAAQPAATPVEPPPAEVAGRPFRFVDLESLPRADAGGVPHVLDDGSHTIPVGRLALPRQRSAFYPVFITAILAGGLSFAAGWVVRGLRTAAPQAAPVVEAKATPAPAPRAPDPPPPAAAPATDQPALAATADRPAGNDPPAAAIDADACRATITTDPGGALVTFGGQTLGETPLNDVEVPCGTGRLIIDHPRYETIDRQLTANPGRSLTVTQNLVRPAGRLDLSSQPGGARFTVQGRAVGSAPVGADVSAFTTVSVTAELAGYKPWSRRVYVRGRKMDLTAKLSPLPKTRTGGKPSNGKPAGASKPPQL